MMARLAALERTGTESYDGIPGIAWLEFNELGKAPPVELHPRLPRVLTSDHKARHYGSMTFLHTIGGWGFAEAIAVPTQGGSATVGCFSRHPESQIKISVELFTTDYAHKLPAQRLQLRLCTVRNFEASFPLGSPQEDPQIPDFSCSLLKVYFSRSSMSHFETDETNQRPMFMDGPDTWPCIRVGN